MKSKTVKSKASFVRNKKQKLYDFLDLKSKRIQFTKSDVATCQSQLKREVRTLNFSCTLSIPTRSKVSKLSQRGSADKIALWMGQLKKIVRVDLSKDARQVTFSVDFEAVGIDYEVAEFNVDFHEVMSQAALAAISKAMKSPLAMQVLEN
ncbi:hypothetical protein OAQ84_01680 [Bdellovibrionales bacterium]|nr:hypothetical protein [Bdellovibrionales bacterium]